MSGIVPRSYTYSSATAGTTYLFKVAARNEVGIGAYSEPFSILAATVPSQPGAPTTAVDASENNIIVTWSEPSQTGGV